MTEIEAIAKFKRTSVLWESASNTEMVEAVKIAINALEKQIPKKPINNKHTVRISDTAVKFVDWWKCGKCNGDLTRQFVCCPYCQTVIDWIDTD